MVAGEEGGKEGGRVEAVKGCPQQENGYDCGMYVLSMAKYLAHLYVTEGGRGGGKEGSPKLDATGLAARVTPDAIDEARRRIGLKIQQLAAAGARS
jgi:Ulp1 family protease